MDILEIRVSKIELKVEVDNCMSIKEAIGRTKSGIAKAASKILGLNIKDENVDLVSATSDHSEKNNLPKKYWLRYCVFLEA